MRARLLTDFKRGAGLVSPKLILVWLGLGVGLLWWAWYMGFYAIESYSGNVQKIDTTYAANPYVAIDSSSIYFFIDSAANSQLPDISVGDHVEILSKPSYQAYGGVASADVVAVQSQRGTWMDSIYGGEVAPYTPATWPLHEALRWSTLALGIMFALFAAASLVRWLTPSAARQTAAPGTGDVSSAPPAQASTAESRPHADPASNGVMVGSLTVLGSSILEAIAVISAFGGCSGYQIFDLMLILATVGLAAGGTTALIFAGRGAAGSPKRTLARRWGIVAVVLAVVTIPINLLLVGLSGFCALG